MAATKWIIDPAHSEVRFKIRHLMITNVTGSFGKFNAEIEGEDKDFTSSKINFTADVDSISTNNEQRDGHLKSVDFFDTAKNPTLTFVSTKLDKVSDEEYTLYGNLTMHGVTKPVKLDVEHGGVITDPWGKTRTGFTIEGKINRKEFGLEWNSPTETGGFVLGDEVKLHANVQFVKQV
jgi:polyisoprenoid-binding protein YceI